MDSISMKKIIFAAVISSFAGQAAAKVLAVCDNLTGFSHYLDGDELTSNFETDGFRGRRIFLIENNNAGQLIYGIATQDNGGEIKIDNNPTYQLGNNISNRTFTFLIDGSRESYTEVYLFQPHKADERSSYNGSVVITQTRHGGTPKASIFYGNCVFSTV